MEAILEAVVEAEAAEAAAAAVGLVESRQEAALKMVGTKLEAALAATALFQTIRHSLAEFKLEHRSAL